MLEGMNESFAPELKCDDGAIRKVRANSFKKIRKIRKKNRMKRRLEKSLNLKNATPLNKPSIGPTKETIAKLKQDPLICFRKKNILDDEQIWAFQRIRHAVRIITDGTQLRTSSFNDVIVQTSRLGCQPETDYEIRIKDYYNNWIERMTDSYLQAGPVLDIIIDEMSLSAADRKWGKRKGWAKGHLQASLDLYLGFSSVDNRQK